MRRLPFAVLAPALAIASLLLAGCGAGAEAEASSATDCNGAAALCAKRLDQVVFAGTHNSYAASTQAGWHFASQRLGIEPQLDDGIDALLIDVHYGIPTADGLVRTDFRAEGADANKVLAALPERARRVAERLAGPLGAAPPPGRSQLYLCHTLCELGAEPLDRELRAIAAFLASHPREVLVVVVEDYVPPRSIAAAFERAGLAPLAATLRRDRPLPTLGQLLAQGKHLVVFAEKQGGSPSWYMPAFSFIQDTPLGAHRPDQLSCARFRGEPDSPLLMLNHWIPPFPPSPRLNRAIGGRFLRHRARRCMRERGFEGAILAVDFYERTAAVQVARQLNGS